MSVADTLAERGARYGAFIEHAKIAQSLQSVLHSMPNWNDLDADMRQALVTITDKIARIGNGDAFYSDSWHDISGYAQLVDSRLKALESEKPVELFEPETNIYDNPSYTLDTPVIYDESQIN